jgi:hypothetical protein
MGLREKRILHQLKTEVLPAYEAAAAKAAGGTKIAWDIDWESFSDCDEAAVARIERWGFKRIIDAIAAVCVDELGKQALQEGLKKIHVKQVNNIDNVAASMANKTLWVCINFSDFYKGYLSEFTIQEVLENGL